MGFFNKNLKISIKQQLFRITRKWNNELFLIIRCRKSVWALKKINAVLWDYNEGNKTWIADTLLSVFYFVFLAKIRAFRTSNL